ncbi:ring-cleaving dioxygenase [Actinomycetes bacterium NPDC127524]
MELRGIHHVSAITANAVRNYEFYTKTMGMRLIKKTVNQDDVSVYHLFYGDDIGTPGTELTFFELPRAARTHEGNNSISEISLRTASDAALEYWKKRFQEENVEHGEIEIRYNRKALPFRDFEGQRLVLISEENENGESGTPWKKSPVPAEFSILGLGPVYLTVPDLEPTHKVLTDLLGFRREGSYLSKNYGQSEIVVYASGKGGPGTEIHLEERKDLQRERLGRGGVHHVAFRTADQAELQEWIKKIENTNFINSGLVDRYYFKSLYFREPNGILFELATDGPGFTADEDLSQLGESLALPPFLEHRRSEIEGKLKPLETKVKEQ